MGPDDLSGDLLSRLCRYDVRRDSRVIRAIQRTAISVSSTLASFVDTFGNDRPVTEPPESMEPLPSNETGRSRALLWILISGVIVRVVLWYLWVGWSPLMNNDAHDYQQLATQ